MSTQIETLKKRLTLGSLPESAKAAIRKQIEQLENEAMGEQESSTKQQEKLEKEEESKEAEVDDKIEKLKKRLTLGSLPESAKAAIRKQIEDAEKLKSEAKKERAEEKKEAEKKQAEVKAKVKEAVEKVKKVVKEAPKKVSAEKTPAKAKAVEKKVEKEVKKEIEKAKTEVKKAKVEGKKVEAKKAEGAKKRKKKFDKMLTDLQRLINKDKKLKALYGSDSPSNLKRDAGRMAKPFGWRYKGEHNYKVPPKSERGNDNTYYEGRPEKADLRRRTYPYLEMGGDVMAKGGSTMTDYTKSFSLVKVKFANPEYNYETSINGDVTESDARKYFVGEMFDVGVYPKENMQKAIDIEFYPKGTYAKGGMTNRNNWVNYAAKYYTVQTQFVNSNGKFESTTNKYEDFNSAKKAYENALSKKNLIKVMLKGHNYTGIDVEIDENDYNMMNYPEYVIVMDSSDKMAKGGSISHYKIKNTKEIFVSYDDAMNYCDKNNLPYSAIIKTKKYADGGMMARGGAIGIERNVDIIAERNKSKIFTLDEFHKYRDLQYKILVSQGLILDSDKNYKKFDELLGAKLNVNYEYADGGMMANGGEIREGKFQAMFYTNEDDGYHIDSEYFDVYPSESDIEYLAKSLNSKYVEIYRDRHNDDSYTFLEETYFIDEEYKLGGMFGKSRYNTGRSWHLDHARHNKKEDYEIPMPNRKGAKKVSSSKSSAASKSAPKRAKTGKYAKASRSSASASSSSRGYNYIPNSQIKSITTVDDKVITKKKILDGAYVRKKNGGMM
jgi:hypothetical protein